MTAQPCSPPTPWPTFFPIGPYDHGVPVRIGLEVRGPAAGLVGEQWERVISFRTGTVRGSVEQDDQWWTTIEWDAI